MGWSNKKIGFDEIGLEKALNFLPYPFLVSEFHNNIQSNIFVNKKFDEEIGYSCQEIPTIHDWFDKAYPDASYRKIIRDEWSRRETLAKANNNDSIILPARIHTKNLGDKWYEVKASIYGPIHFVAFVNINDKVTREQELERLNENKNRTLSILSHDLRSPLSSLFSVLQLTVNDNVSESEKKMALKKLNNQVFQLIEFLDTTLEWTKVNFEVLKTNAERLDVKKLTEGILNVYQSSYTDKAIDVAIDIETTKAVYADQGVLSVLIRNIISNAIKFTPIKGRISIHAASRNGKYVYAVENTGNGISKEKISMILNKNYVSEHGTNGEKGLGLGLKLCQHLLENIGGHLEIESPDHKSTIVKIVI